VIRPPTGLWNCVALFESVVPGFSKSTASSTHAFDRSRGPHGQGSTTVVSTSSNPIPYSVHSYEDHGGMEIHLDGDHTMLSNSPQSVLPRNRRDVLHKQMAEDLREHIRTLTGKAAKLQQYRREHESMHSPSNVKFSEVLPSKNDWSHVWSLRDCLKFLVKIPPPQRRSWTFGDGEASSLADFLGMPGEKGARPGREWAKHD